MKAGTPSTCKASIDRKTLWKVSFLSLIVPASLVTVFPLSAQVRGDANPGANTELDPVGEMQLPFADEPAEALSAYKIPAEGAIEGYQDEKAGSDEIENSLGTELYGPPAPEVENGRLAEIAWSEAPREFPPPLEAAIVTVTEKHPSARSARAALRGSASEVRAAKWLRFPSVTADLAYLDSSTSPEPQLVVETPIWSGGRIGAGIRRAKAAEDEASARYVGTVQSLAITTSNTYFEIVRLTQAELLLAESVKVHQQLVDTMQRRVNQEVSPLADLELARSRTAQIRQQYNVVRSQRLTALRIMAELVADPSYDIGPVPYYDPDARLSDPEILVDQTLAYDPELRRFQAQADIAREEMSATRATIFPQLNAQFSYDDFFKSRVGVVLRAQTTGGLSQVAQVNAGRRRMEAALEDIRDQEQLLRREVAADVIQYEAAKERAAISTAASQSAFRVSESYFRQFIAGRRSWLDVMNALREAVTAQLSEVDAQATAMSTAARLVLRSGRWRPEFDGPDNSDLPEGMQR